MKKTLIALGLAGALLVPAGAALAATVDPTPTACAQEQPIRNRDHAQTGSSNRDQTHARTQCDTSAEARVQAHRADGTGRGAADCQYQS